MALTQVVTKRDWTVRLFSCTAQRQLTRPLLSVVGILQKKDSLIKQHFHRWPSNSLLLQQQQDNSPPNTNKRERIFTVPNVLSLSRIIATPILGYMIVKGNYDVALGLFVAAGITDLLDGWIARSWDQRTVFGAALDPFADKLLVTTLTISLCAAGLLPLPITSLIVARDGGLIASGFYLRYISLPLPKTLSRYFDFKLPSVDLRPSNLSKANTALQLILLAASLAAPVFSFEGHVALSGLALAVAGTTIGSGVDYILNANKYIVFVKHPTK